MSPRGRFSAFLASPLSTRIVSWQWDRCERGGVARAERARALVPKVRVGTWPVGIMTAGDSTGRTAGRRRKTGVATAGRQPERGDHGPADPPSRRVTNPRRPQCADHPRASQPRRSAPCNAMVNASGSTEGARRTCNELYYLRYAPPSTGGPAYAAASGPALCPIRS